MRKLLAVLLGGAFILGGAGAGADIRSGSSGSSDRRTYKVTYVGGESVQLRLPKSWRWVGVAACSGHVGSSSSEEEEEEETGTTSEEKQCKRQTITLHGTHNGQAQMILENVSQFAAGN